MNEDLMEINDLGKNSKGGTEIIQQALYSKLDRDLLSKFQIWFSRYYPEKVDKSKYQILFLHDLPNDPASKHLEKGGWEKFDKLIFVSNWQMQSYIQFFGIPYSKCAVIHNAIEPMDFKNQNKDPNKIKLIYHSTPHRGLEILVPVFERLAEIHENIELDVYSSFNLYGWEERDKPYEQLYERCRANPKINYFGTVSNEEIRKALVNADIFAYPSIWLETSCLCLIEAMAAGLDCIHPNLGALPETAANWTDMYQYNEEFTNHGKVFFDLLNTQIEMFKDTNYTGMRKEFSKSQIAYMNSFYSWKARIPEWELLLGNILKSLKVSSIPKEMFIYRTGSN